MIKVIDDNGRSIEGTADTVIIRYVIKADFGCIFF